MIIKIEIKKVDQHPQPLGSGASSVRAPFFSGVGPYNNPLFSFLSDSTV